jgi:hypothetical protein
MFALFAGCGATQDSIQQTPENTTMTATIPTTPKNVPALNYVPFGYIDNPHHSAVLNRSGVFRTVPPVGMGWWRRQMPWSYGEGSLCNVNYLSFLHLSFIVDSVCLHQSEDFTSHKIKLVSNYHTKNVMSYDWELQSLRYSVKYFLASENVLACVLTIQNDGATDKNITLHATNIFGFPEKKWWGGDGVAGRHNAAEDLLIGKIWAGGDVFALGADKKSACRRTFNNEQEWMDAVRTNDLSNGEPTSKTFPGAIYNKMSYNVAVGHNASSTITLFLARGVNESEAIREYKSIKSSWQTVLGARFAEDETFYQTASVLTGDWSDEWKQGWIYDLETLRMTVRQPLGIYETRWDGMQIFTPRSVLGETMLDMMALSYADMECAKEVVYGTFASAPAPNVPCSREDGSMNMIGESGEECGTAPTWGLPFHVIRSMYLRDRDTDWLRRLYPYLKSFANWWLEHRTDKQGWFHCDNSWESGQDGSRRFLITEGAEGATATYVRTVDVEAAMANAFLNLAYFAEMTGDMQDVSHWLQLASDRIKRTQSMYVDGWFRDFDARTGQPIVLKDYMDIMMLMPVSLGVASKEQMEGIKPKIEYFAKNPGHWLEWPSFTFPFVEAAFHSGMDTIASEVVYGIGTRVYKRLSDPRLQPVGKRNTGLPEQYNYRIPGIACEYWPVEPTQRNMYGAENYGWGATLPLNVIRGIFGFREDEHNPSSFLLIPTLPKELLERGGDYGITNLRFADLRFDLSVRSEKSKALKIKLSFDTTPHSFIVKKTDGSPVPFSQNGTIIELSTTNGERLHFDFKLK